MGGGGADGGGTVANIVLKKFDISKIDDDKVVVLIGKRDTGKSFLVRDLLYHHKDLPIGTVISGTESANSFYGTIIPSIFIHEEYTPELLHNAVRRQKLVVKRMVREVHRTGRTGIDPRAFLVLDDCLYDNDWVKDKNIRCLFMNGRHYKVMFVITMQYPLGVPPNLRCNIDYVFILRENIVSNRKRIYDNFAGMFPSFEVFCQVMDQCTEDYECLVIHNNAKSNRIEDQVFWYKAAPHPDFRLCAREYWDIAAQQQRDADDDSGADSDGGDLASIGAIKRKNRVLVRKV
jgi:hypothetical protein